MSTRRISVLIPSYNHEPFLERAVRSVLDQDDPDLELVVVDDGSTDGSRALLARLAAESGGRMRVHEQENAGAHAAMAKAVELSSGDVLAFLNSDDYFGDGRLARLREHIPPAGDFLVFSGLSMVDENGDEVSARTPHARWYQTALRQSVQCPTVGFALLCNNLSVTSGNLVVARALFEAVGGFRSFEYCHDWDFVLRCAWHVEPIFVPEVLHHYRLHASNTIHASDQDAVDAEYGQIAREFLRSCEAAAPANPLAPCRANWPHYFPYFARTHSRFDSKLIADLVGDADLVAFPAGATAGWTAWRGGAVEIARRDDLGVLVSAASAASANPAEAQLLLRELALVRMGLHERYADIVPGGKTDLHLVQSWSALVGATLEGSGSAG